MESGIISQRVYFVNNCETIAQVEEQERSFKRIYGENKIPDVLEMAISNKKVMLKSDLIAGLIITEKYLRENK